jgi:hypothetical protein
MFAQGSRLRESSIVSNTEVVKNRRKRGPAKKAGQPAIVSFLVFVLVGAFTVTIVVVAAPVDLDVSAIKITRGAVAV